MKAVYIEAHGDADVLQYGDRPGPTPGPGDVVVRVGASALNRLDIFTREGQRGLEREFPPPLILGGDTAGEVVETGSNVSSLSVGDRVVVNPRISCGVCQWCGSGRDELCRNSRFLGTALDGSYAEQVVVPEVNAYRLEGDVSFADAAAIPTTYLPVWNMAVRRAALQPWETALVFSASAGVGAAAIQVFKNVVGATVIATTSTPEKAGASPPTWRRPRHQLQRGGHLPSVFARSRAAPASICSSTTWEPTCGPTGSRSLRAGGRYCICGATSGLRAELHLGLLFSRQIEIYGGYMGSREDMRQIVASLNRGVIIPAIHHTYPLAQAADAHRAMEATNFFGKLLLQP